MNCIQDEIKQKLGFSLCQQCISLFLRHKSDYTSSIIDTATETATPSRPRNKCMLCLDILSHQFTNSVLEEIEKSFECYGGFDANVLSKDASPTVAIPVHAVVRAQCLLAAIEDADLESCAGIKNKLASPEVYTRIKEEFRSNIRQKLMERCNTKSYSSLDDLEPDIKQLLYKEESGHMNCHVIAHAGDEITLPTKIMPLPYAMKKRERKRFRGNDPTNKQGGDPRANEDKRIRKDFEVLLENAKTDTARDSLQASLMERSLMLQTLDATITNLDKRKDLVAWIQEESQSFDSVLSLCSIHVASWRSAFYIKGRYTKARRDCSQTPFFVPYDKDEKRDDTKNMYKRLGVTSVEEEICPVVARLACGGVSTQNNIRDSMQGAGSNIVFGMAKVSFCGRRGLTIKIVYPLNR